MSDNQQPQLTQEEHDQWVREQFQRANKHLAENDVLFDSVVIADSRYLAPYVAIWKIKAIDNTFYWVISGDVPVDFTAQDNAEDAREALRYFSMHWQLRAENIRQTPALDKVQVDYANLLQVSAENLYGTYENDGLWKSA